MSSRYDGFAQHLCRLAERDRAAVAALRRSLAFAPGTYAPTMPYVEPFTAMDGSREADRAALYLAAGLFAANPRHRSGTTVAAALAEVRLRRQSESIDKRFIALLGAEPDALPVHLRHVVTLLGADDTGFDVAALALDLAAWLDPWQLPRLGETPRDRVRQRWARDFYGALARAAHHDDTDSDPTPTTTEEPRP
jgi:CRISPR system Cascade subunit CasB